MNNRNTESGLLAFGIFFLRKKEKGKRKKEKGKRKKEKGKRKKEKMEFSRLKEEGSSPFGNRKS